MRSAVAALGIYAVLGGIACGKGQPDSVVVVTVTAPPGMPQVTQLRANLTYAGRSDIELFPSTKATTPIDFVPAATFALILPRSRTGRIVVDIDALDANSRTVASGTGSTDILVGGRADALVPLGMTVNSDAGAADAGGNAFDARTSDGNSLPDILVADASPGRDTPGSGGTGGIPCTGGG